MRVTLKDIARACDVDVATVSRALNEAYGVHERTRKKVLAAAERLNYRANRLARGLVTGHSHTLAMVISNIRNPFFAELARGAEDAAYQSGYDLVLCNSDLDPAKQRHYIHSLLEKRVEGILMNTVAGLSRAEQEELTRSRVPIVLLNRPPVTLRGFSTVLADNYHGGYLAGEYLAGKGHTEIGHLTGRREHGNLMERTKGFQKALEEAGATAVIVRGPHSSEGASKMMKELLNQKRALTALFAANDAMAFGALRAIFESGRRVPEDISVMGFDNVEMAELISPPLTTIHQPKYEMGWAAVEILLRQAARPESWMPEHRLLEVKLVERESCRAQASIN